MDKLKVFVVDDEKDARENLEVILTMRGNFDVVGTASNGEEALAALEVVDADIAVIDLCMPVMSGAQLIRVLKAKYPEMKKLVFTAHFDEKNFAEAIINGADAYIIKGIAAKLLDAINLLMHGQSIFDSRVVEWIRKSIVQPAEGEIISSEILFNKLAYREISVCEKLADGLSNAEIAKELFIAESTVRNYISSIYGKTGIHDRAALAVALQKSLRIRLK